MDSVYFQESFTHFSSLVRTFLKTSLFHLSRKLVLNEVMDDTLIPKAIRHCFDELIFGGVVFDCRPPYGYEIRNTFQIYFTVLPLQEGDGFVLVGPYRADGGGEEALEGVLMRSQIPLEDRESYENYFYQLPVLPSSQIRVILDAFAYQLYRGSVPKLLRSVELSVEHPSPCPVFEEDTIQARADALQERYKREKEFMESVAKGDLSILDHFSMIELNRFPNKLRNEKNQMIILNTLLRKAIEQGKVHPYYIDQISAKWSVLIEQLDNPEKAAECKRDMVYDYCRASRNHSLAQYTPVVRAMINFVHFNLSDPGLALFMISEKLKATPSYLSRQFNKEVGKGLPEYITEERIKLAKSLFEENMEAPVGKIAQAVGFSDMNYFAKVFRKYTGQTPTQYRKARQDV